MTENMVQRKWSGEGLESANEADGQADYETPCNQAKGFTL